MASSEDRQARALEGILGQLVFLNQHLRKLAEVKDLPGQEEMRPLVTDDGRQVGWLFANEKDVRGVQFGPMNVATVEGIIKDVY